MGSVPRHPIQEVTLWIRAETIPAATEEARKTLKDWAYRVARVTLVQEHQEE